MRRSTMLVGMLLAGSMTAGAQGAGRGAAAGGELPVPVASVAGAPRPLGVGAARVRLAIINTASLHVREGLLFAGGDFGKEVLNTFSSILVQHGDEVLLFDSGLGSRIDAQYRADMPHWQRPFFRYEAPVRPAVAQLAGQGLPPVSRIILSHSHWDHASALEDFPGAEVWVTPEELARVAQPRGGVGGTWATQVGKSAIKWRELRFTAAPCAGFARSLDLFGDGSLVLVPLPGHTAGSVGLLATTTAGHRYFFVGDAVWSAAALREEAPRFWPARLLVDQDAAATQAVIGQIRRVQRQQPDLIVVPAHDGRVQAALGFFPKWLP